MPTRDAQIRRQLTALIATRWRQLLVIQVFGLCGLALTNWLLVPGYPRYLFAFHALGSAVSLASARLLREEPFASRPVAFGLALVALAALQRSVVGWLSGEVELTAIIAVAVTMTVAAAIPWGPGPQVVAASLALAAIAANGALVGGPVADLGPAVGAIGVTLGVSILIARHVERSAIELISENWRRRRSEADLALLNAELEQRVRIRTAELAAVIENSRDAIWSVDRNGAVHVMNGAALRRLGGRDPRALGGADPFAALSAAERDQLRRLYARAFAGEHVEIEQTVDTPNGVGHFVVAVHPIVEDGTVVGAAVFSRDVTARRRAEEQARQHQADLAHVLRISTMGEMAAGLAHEINQPLGAIANYALGAARRLREGGPVERAVLLEIVERIGGEALRGGEIIRRMRELLQKETPPPQPVDLNAVARASARLLEGEARRQGVHLDLELAPAVPPVMGDPVQLEQVLINLLLNGIDACAAASGDARVVVCTAAQNGGVTVAVSDRGVGLPSPPADVFAPFFTTKPRGLGMGLSISRSIVEFHGGRLDAEANPDRGSTFRFTLPSDTGAAVAG
jgi:PAS domain S-box-containing protein